MSRVVTSLRAAIVISLAALIIIFALIYSAFRLALPLVSDWHDEIEERVSLAIGVPVEIGTIDAEWWGLGPRLNLGQVRLLSPDTTTDPAPETAVAELPNNDGRLELMSFSSIRVDLNLLDLRKGSGFRPRKVEVEGTRLVVEQNRSGSFSVRGFSLQPTANQDFLGGALKLLGDDGDFELSNTEIVWAPYREAGPTPLSSSRFDLTLQVRESHYALKLVGTPPSEIAESLEMQINATGDSADPDSIKAKLFLQLSEVALTSEWIEPWLGQHIDYSSGSADISLQMDWQEQRPQRLDGHVHLKQLGSIAFATIDLSGGFGWRPENPNDPLNAWTVTLDTLNATVGQTQYKHGPIAIVQRGDSQHKELAIAVDTLPLDGALPLLERAKLAPEILLKWLHELQPEGQLHDARFAVSIDQDPITQQRKLGDLTLDAQLANVMTSEVPPGVLTPMLLAKEGEKERRQRGIPGIRGLNGHIQGRLEDGFVDLSSNGFTFDWDYLYPQPVVIDQLAGAIHWLWSKENGLQLSWDDLKVKEGEAKIKTDGRLTVAGKNEDHLTLDAELIGGTFDQANEYLPHIIPVKALTWLQTALLGGNMNISYRSDGPLVGFPYSNGEGISFAIARIQEGQLQFHESWPTIDRAEVELQFIGESMQFTGSGGEMKGVKINGFTGQVPDLRNPLLTLKADGQGHASEFLEILRDSPLQEPIGELLVGLSADGEADMEMELTIPLSAPETLKTRGKIVLHDVDLLRGEFDSVHKLNGTVHFTRLAMSADNLDCEYLGVTCQASLTVPLEANRHSSILATSTLNIGEPHSQMHDRLLLERFLPRIVSNALHGKIPFEIDLSGTPDYSPASVITAYSSLIGMRDSSPEPLTLSAEESDPLRMVIDRRFKDAFKVTVTRRELSSSMWFTQLNDQVAFDRGQIVVGTSLAQLPATKGLYAHIETERFDFDSSYQWLQAQLETDAPSDSKQELLPRPFQQVSAKASVMTAGKQKWHNAHVVLQRVQNDLRLDLDSQEMRGTMTLPNRAGLVQQERGALIQANFDHFHWPSPLLKSDPENPDFVPNSFSSMGLDPRLLPSAKITIGDFRIGPLRLGHLELVTAPVPTGLKIDRFTARGGIAHLDINGRWDRSDEGDDSFIGGTLRTGSAARLFTDLGLESIIESENAVFTSDLHWHGEPQQFDLLKADGTVGLQLDNGQLTSIDPGAGRLLGLFNFYSLPRRLMLDFSDVTAEGFGYDKIRGSFTLLDGNAYTRDLKVSASSANVSIIGRAGMIERDYDQRIVVSPRVSSSLAIAGAALTPGGLGFGAVLLLGQEIFGRPFENATQLRYKLSGSWDEPVIESVGGMLSGSTDPNSDSVILGPRSRHSTNNETTENDNPTFLGH